MFLPRGTGGPLIVVHRNEGLHQSGLAAGHGHASTLQHEPQPPVTQETTSRLAPPRRLLRILPRPEFCLRCCELPSTTRPISLAASKRFIHCIRVLVLQPPSQEHRRAQFTARPFSPPRRPHAVQPSIATAVHIPYSTLARPRPQSLRIAPPSAIANGHAVVSQLASTTSSRLATAANAGDPAKKSEVLRDR